VKALDDAGSQDVSFFENRKYLAALKETQAAAVFIAPDAAGKLPSHAVPLIAKDPYRCFARALELFFPDAGHPKVGSRGAALADASADIEEGAIIEAGAIIGPEAQIGRGTRIAAGAVIGYRVAIGRDCFIGPGASITHALIGNRVIVHAGARIGQDGFGFVMGPGGHYKVRQVGRVIIQDNVEIGANTTIDRGALKDTIIGEGTKIDNLVQIAHNVVIGRHCVIAAQTGISGSTILEDYVAMGGQVGTVGHIRIGAGAQIGAQSGVSSDIPRGERWAGYPAKPASSWAREVALLKRMVRRKSSGENQGGLDA
jgi:UDP-3-O-[3-hydroxymyristoyl] glucosamine N-acyltransferase